MRSDQPDEILSKLPGVGTTIFTVMSAMAERCEAINLSQGFPDYDAPDALKELLCEQVRAGQNQYPPMAGVNSLRMEIAKKIKTSYARALDSETEITVVPGATEAIFCAVMALVNPGDEVILFDPAYDCYGPAIQMAGGVPVHLPLVLPNFRYDWDHVSNAISSKTRMIIVNSPHNPTGTIWSEEDLAALRECVAGTRILIISDEVYEHLVFDGQRHLSVLADDELYSRSIAVFSFGKTLHVTGWKTGYAIGPEYLMRELRKVHQYVTFVGVRPIQMALAEFMIRYPNYFVELQGFYQEKRDLFQGAMKASRFRLTPASGTYFQLADYSRISSVDDVTMCKRLTEEHGVAAIPLSAFYKELPPHRLVRFCFAKREETLLDAADALSGV